MLSLISGTRQLPPLVASAEVDPRVPEWNRLWNYLLGGKEHYPADRFAAEGLRARWPDLVYTGRTERQFLSRVTRNLAGEERIGQFLEVGAALPLVDATHEVASRVNPRARVVYGAVDELVLAHVRALLTVDPPAVTDHIHADVADPDAIVRAASAVLDFTKPVAILLRDVQFVLDDFTAQAVTGRLIDALAPGSHLVITHLTNALHGQATDAAVKLWNRCGSRPLTTRTPAQIGQLISGLEMLRPGAISCPVWRPEHDPLGAPRATEMVCVVGRKR